MRRSCLLVGLLLLPLVGLVGCGGGGGGSGPSIPTETASPTPGATDTPRPGATPTPTGPALPPLTSPTPLIEGHRMGADNWANGSTATGGQSGGVIDGLSCGVMDEAYHVHTHLSIFLDGKQLAVPMAIGLKNPHYASDADKKANGWPDGFAEYGDCNYALHTHDLSGKLHVEAPVPTTFTMGQFFDVWGEPLTNSNVAGITGKKLRIFLKDGGSYSEYFGNPRTITMKSQREVTFVLGTAPAKVPTFTWFSAIQGSRF